MLQNRESSTETASEYPPQRSSVRSCHHRAAADNAAEHHDLQSIQLQRLSMVISTSPQNARQQTSERLTSKRALHPILDSTAEITQLAFSFNALASSILFATLLLQALDAKGVTEGLFA